MPAPDPATLYPIPDLHTLCFLNRLIDHPQIAIGDFTYYHDFENVSRFEQNVKYLFEHSGDQLIIGKFCMIASDVTFIMNGANHLTEAVSAYPFSIFGGDWTDAMKGKEYPIKGDLTIGNDVWIGYGATIMAGVHIGDGAIIGTRAVVTRDVPPYTIVGGNPATVIRTRFSEEIIQKLLRIKWWDWPLEKITSHVHLLTDNRIDQFLSIA